MPLLPCRRQLATLLCLPLLLSLAACAVAQPKPARSDVGGDAGRAILWVGNSFFYYNNSMHGHYGDLVAVGRARGATAAPR